MKKREILYLINLYKAVNNNMQIANIGEYQFPDNKYLEEELKILKKEREKRKKIFEKQSNELNMLQKTCSHEIRASYQSLFEGSVNCLICGNNVNIEKNHGIYMDCNRNSYYCEFPQSYYDDDDEYHEGVDIEIIYNYIKEILKDKEDEDNIDLVQEMKKLNPDRCKYIEKPLVKEHYVLIIGGSNIIKIDDNHYLTSNNTPGSIELTHHLLGIPKIKVTLIENPNSYLTHKYKELFPYENTDYGCKFNNYSTEKELIELLYELSKKCQFDLVIDMSDIFELVMKDNQVRVEGKRIDLSALFLYSQIVKFDNCNNGLDSVYYKNDYTDESYQIMNGIEEVGNYIKTLTLNNKL